MIGSLLLPVLIPLLKIMHLFHLVDHPDRGNRSRRSEGDCLLAQWVIFGLHYFALQALWQFLQHFLRWFLGLIYLINRGTNLTSQFIPIWRSLTQACLVSKAFRRARRKRKKLSGSMWHKLFIQMVKYSGFPDEIIVYRSSLNISLSVSVSSLAAISVSICAKHFIGTVT